MILIQNIIYAFIYKKNRRYIINKYTRTHKLHIFFKSFKKQNKKKKNIYLKEEKQNKKKKYDGLIMILNRLITLARILFRYVLEK